MSAKTDGMATGMSRKGLLVAESTEDLLKSGRLNPARGRMPGGKIHEDRELLPQEAMRMMQERNGNSSRTLRLTQANLTAYSLKVKQEEKASTNKNSISGINMTQVFFLFCTVFLLFSCLIEISGFQLNRLAGPAWMNLGIDQSVLEARIFLDQVSVLKLLNNFIYMDAGTSQAVVGDITKINCVVFSIVVQVTTILIQVGSKEVSTNVVQIFVTDKVIVGGMTFYTMTLAYMVVLSNTISDVYIPRGEILLGSFFTLVCVLALIPYFIYLSRMLNPLKLVRKVAETGLKACTYRDSKDYHIEDPKKLKEMENDRNRAIWAVENIAQFGLNAMKNQRPKLVYTCVEVLSHFLVGYGSFKDFWSDEWFKVTMESRDTPDFFSLSDKGIQDLQDRRSWLEWKVLRQYQNLFIEALNVMRDVTFVVAVNTRRIAEACAQRHDYHSLEYCVRFFNTFLRLALQKKDTAAVHNILHQYQLLCSSVLHNDMELLGLVQQRKRRGIQEGLEFFQVDDLIQITGNFVVEESRDIIIAMEKKIISVAQYFVYYSSVALQNGLKGVPESIAHELALLCETAFLRNRECHEELLLTFLMLHEASYEKDLNRVAWGIRVAQIKLATFYAVNNAPEFFHCIQNTFHGEDHADLVRAWRHLERAQDREFWEISDRGTNAEFLETHRRARLPSFFAPLGVTMDDLDVNRNYLAREESSINAFQDYARDHWRDQREQTNSSECVDQADRAFQQAVDKGARNSISIPVLQVPNAFQPEYVTPTVEPFSDLRRKASLGTSESDDVRDPVASSQQRAKRDSVRSNGRRRSSVHEMILEGYSPAEIGVGTLRTAIQSLAAFKRNSASNRGSDSEGDAISGDNCAPRLGKMAHGNSKSLFTTPIEEEAEIEAKNSSKSSEDNRKEDETRLP
ncbi:Uncharacterized protein SCF082_LOCUS43486 [Durusdinium trenchii]|uniref:Uncharacterized protein n=1 Tax=Durusdinium trenchii TaxID=1381693 RepID=A0ABP0QZN4_9DINO